MNYLAFALANPWDFWGLVLYFAIIFIPIGVIVFVNKQRKKRKAMKEEVKRKRQREEEGREIQSLAEKFKTNPLVQDMIATATDLFLAYINGIGRYDYTTDVGGLYVLK